MNNCCVIYTDRPQLTKMLKMGQLKEELIVKVSVISIACNPLGASFTRSQLSSALSSLSHVTRCQLVAAVSTIG